MILKVYQTGFGEHSVGSTSIQLTETPTDYTVVLPAILEMSDRCQLYPTDDPRAWAYNLGFQCNLIVRASMNKENNSIKAKVISFSDWRVERSQGTTPAGKPVVQGNYSWYSSVNGAEIAHYVGPTVSGEGDYTYAGEGGTMGIDFGTIGPQQEGDQREYANLLNHVNGLRSQAWVTVRNDLPADYRPGAVLDNKWLTHNRSNGQAHILTSGSTWTEMRTINGGINKGDIPSIMTSENGAWINQRRFGKY